MKKNNIFKLFTGKLIYLVILIIFVSCEKDDDKIFKVTFDAHGGSPALVEVNVPLNERVTLPEFPTKTGCDMIGWYWKLDTTRLFDYEYARINGDTELIARWVKGTGQRFTITFYSRKGAPNPLPQSVIANTLARFPLNPYWPDYKVTNAFKGWYTDSITFSTAFDLKKTKITDNISLFAKWSSDIK